MSEKKAKIQLEIKENEIEIIRKIKKGKFSKWVWVIFLFGGLFMVYGGIMNILVYFEKGLPLAPPSWHILDTKISLIIGIFILFAAVYMILKSFEVKSIIEGETETEIRPLMRVLLIVCIVGIIADIIAGYYARGFLLGLLGLLYLNYALENEKKIRNLSISLVILTLIIISFILTGGK